LRKNKGKILNIFKSSIYKTKIQHEKAKEYFLNLLNTEKEDNASVHISNKGGFQTKNFSYIDDKDINQKLFIDPCFEYFDSFNLRKPTKNWGIKMASFWINQNFMSDWNVMHNHLPSNFSGIWYLKAPKDCGKIVFQNGDMLVLNESNFDYFDDPHFYSRFFLDIEDNDLVLFPSHMLHFVEPNKTNEDRISLAFNIMIEPTNE
jgi:uncharacterized protein (TIGR02466 family)